MERGSYGILSCNDYHGFRFRGHFTFSEMSMYLKTMRTTLRCKCKSNKLCCSELCICSSEDESCDKVIGDESVNDASLTDDM